MSYVNCEILSVGILTQKIWDTSTSVQKGTAESDSAQPRHIIRSGLQVRPPHPVA